MHWSADGNTYTVPEQQGLTRIDIRTGQKTIVLPADKLTKPGTQQPMPVTDFAFTPDSAQALIFTNTARVWRYNTRGDYYLIDRKTGVSRQVGKSRPAQSLMYAKLSPNGRSVAYVSEHNLFVEDVATGKAVQLTTDGTRKRINGTFDWAYEEEFGCRDGFRWSPDSKQIAYWQIDATKIPDYLMLNTTDSNYSYTVPVEYPKVGVSPSPARVGVVAATGGKTNWLPIPGDAQQHYLTRMEWLPKANTLIVQQLNRKQNQSIVFVCNPATQAVTPIHTESNNTWIDIKSRWNDDDPSGWEWLDGGKAFVWVSEKDGWRHIYKVSTDGKKETLLTPGDYDIETISLIDEPANQLYFIASPGIPTSGTCFAPAWMAKGKPNA